MRSLLTAAGLAVACFTTPANSQETEQTSGTRWVELRSALIGCGVTGAATQIDWSDELQAVEIIISGDDFTDPALTCIADVSWAQMLLFQFESVAVDRRYSALHAERPAARRFAEETRQHHRLALREAGLLERLPTYQPGGDLAALAVAIETLVGFEPGTVLEARNGVILIGARRGSVSISDLGRFRLMLSVLELVLPDDGPRIVLLGASITPDAPAPAGGGQTGR